MNLLDRVRRHVKKIPDTTPIVAKTLYHLGPPEAVDAALSGLVEKGLLLRASDTIFGIPVHSRFGITLAFWEMDAARAYCEANGYSIGRIPAEWANRVRLSTQVVVLPSYLTDGPTHEIPYGKGRTLHFTHASPRDMRLTQSLGGGALLGLEWERPPFPYVALKSLHKLLPPDDWQVFLAEVFLTGGWVAHATKAFEATRLEREAPDCSNVDLGTAGLPHLVEHAFLRAFRGNEARRDERHKALERTLWAQKEEAEHDA